MWAILVDFLPINPSAYFYFETSIIYPLSHTSTGLMGLYRNNIVFLFTLLTVVGENILAGDGAILISFSAVRPGC
jgi:hypothetical protein